MTEAEILAETYDDAMCVYRPYKGIDPETGETVFFQGTNGKKIHSDVPCALSSPTGGKITKNGMVIKAITEYSLFYCPDIHVEKNDTVVIQHLGKMIVCSAGLEKSYCSHNNLPLRMDEEDA